MDRDFETLALISWSLFSGLVLWEESKRTLDPRKNFLKATLEMAFEVLGRGMVQRCQASLVGPADVGANRPHAS
jgi:hypothetical protein